jgi:hypothetical protein
MSRDRRAGHLTVQADRVASGCADEAYDLHEFVDDLRELNVTPHIA